MSKLLILGNGFDLYCNLKSSYRDFFEHLKKTSPFKEIYDIVNGNNRLGNSDDNVNLIWLLLVVYNDLNKEYLWKDIEDILNTFIHKSFRNYNINIGEILRILSRKDELKGYLNDWNDHSPLSKFLKYSERNYFDKFQTWIPKNSFNPAFDGHYEQKSTEDVLIEVMKDLNDIEDQFKRYLQSIISDEYNRKAYRTIMRLIESDPVHFDSLDENSIINTPIISFNYTRLNLKNSDLPQYKNIHGYLYDVKPIIFGIDSYDIDPIKPVYLFTKTFRVSMLSVNSSLSGIEFKKIDELVIYGHSLNEQDYSYFFAIFNKLNISDSDVTIKLYYSNYDKIDRAQERNIAIQKLIYEYEKLFNKPKGLYHRMLVENRVYIEELP